MMSYKMLGRVIFTGVMVLAISGCSTAVRQKAAKGAVAGGAGAAFVGGVTDLILHGEVGMDDLVENAVAGAVGGATAGAVAGHREDKQKAATAKQSAAPEASSDLIKKIGDDNYKALNDLIYYKYEDAYKRTLKAARSKDVEIQEAAYLIQALIDKDRGNDAGMKSSLDEFVKINSKVSSQKAALKELNKLSRKLEDQRKIKGVQKP